VLGTIPALRLASLEVAGPRDGASLYAANTLAAFWRSSPPSSGEAWDCALQTAARHLPDEAQVVLARGGWNALMEHVLGEAQFGTNRYRLTSARQLYYRLRAILPRRVTAFGRRHLTAKAPRRFRLRWPIEDRYVHFMHELGQRTSSDAEYIRAAQLWPGRADFAFALTHDVERAEGHAFVPQLADLDEKYGFRSSFNFVLEDYAVDHAILRELTARGFEVGIHGLHHDGSMFSSWANFVRDSQRLARYAATLGIVGFRSPATHRNPTWMQQLPFEYDASFFDTDPFEVMPGGTMSIWPFFCGRFVELPYTLPQDHTLLVVLGKRDPRLWLDKVDFIARWNGMAMLIAHPDFLIASRYRAVYEEFLQEMQHRVRLGQSDGSYPAAWHALPLEIARWWRDRARAPED
jgi:peptidoglycan/xylan/chitin deacetylase (PgdA/CDA1 family)